MVSKITNGKIILGDKIDDALNIYIEGERISKITKEALPCDEVIDAKGAYVSPGFIDIHCHGGGGGDFSDGVVDAFLSAAELHAKGGTTTLVPTLSATSLSVMLDAFRVLDEANEKNTKGSYLPGFHLEGPYFALSQAGAQNPDYIHAPKKEEYDEVLSHRKVLRWSSAPELEGTEAFVRTLLENNVIPAIAHSDADFDCAVDAFNMGVTLATHLYSGMSTVHRKNAYRTAGVVEAAFFLDGMDVEIIADAKHLPPSLLKLIYKIKGPDRIALVTDALRGAGYPDGTEFISGPVGSSGSLAIIEDGVAKMPDRQAFAGSVTTANCLVKNMVTLADVPLCDAVKMATETPARIMNFRERGKLCEGYFADIVIFDKNFDVQKTISNGNIIYSK